MIRGIYHFISIVKVLSFFASSILGGSDFFNFTLFMGFPMFPVLERLNIAIRTK